MHRPMMSKRTYGRSNRDMRPILRPGQTVVVFACSLQPLK